MLTSNTEVTQVTQVTQVTHKDEKTQPLSIEEKDPEIYVTKTDQNAKANTNEDASNVVISDKKPIPSQINKLTQWECEKCTFINSMSSSVCQVCQNAQLSDDSDGNNASRIKPSSHKVIMNAYGMGKALEERLPHFVEAYDTITIPASLIFTFGITLASNFASKHDFGTNYRMYLFHIFICLTIGCSLHCIIILSYIQYKIKRLMGQSYIDQAKYYLESTYRYRNHARYTFVGCIILFVASLCVLYFDGLPSILAILNASILIVIMLFIAISICRMEKKPKRSAFEKWREWSCQA